MKVLFKKIKGANKGMKFFYFVSLLFYFISFGFFIKSILQLEGIETIIRILLIVLFALYGLFFLIFGLTSFIQKKKKTFIPLVVFALLFASCFSFSSYYITRFYRAIDQFSQKETSVYTTVLLSLNNHELKDASKIGMIDDENNRENYILAKELIEKESLKNDIEYYDDINILVAALYNGEVEAILITKDYPVLLGNEEKYRNIVNETTVLKSYSKEMKTEESTMTTTKNLTEPFSVLVLGVDSENQDGLDPNAAFNGDTLMLITFNPQTLNATVFSIPRDMYVPISCNNNRYNKVNAAAYGGTSCVVNTIQNMTDIEIDYFVKVDFKAVVDLVDAMGGVDVDVEAPDYDYYNSQYGGRLCEQNSLRQFGEHLVCMDTGMQHLNGEQALAYARNRHGYLESDIARNRHQQQVLEAMAKKLIQTASFSDFEHLLDTVSKHIATNMKTSQILSFYQTIKNMLSSALAGGDFINIQKTYLTYYNLNVPQGSALGYYQGSMDAITKAMKENLGILKSETIRTFAYDYKEDYERSSEVIGKGIYTGSTLSFMPNFVGNSVSAAKSFANMNDLSLHIEYESNPEEIAGIILRQSVSAGTMVNSISGFTIYVNNPVKDTDEDKDKDTDKDEDAKNDDDLDGSSKPKPSDDKPDSSTNTDSSSKEDEDKKDQNADSSTEQNKEDNQPKPSEEGSKPDDSSTTTVPGNPVAGSNEGE